MKFRLLLVAVALFIGNVCTYGQLLQWNTFGNAGTETTEPSVANDANIAATNLTQGSITASANGNRFGGNGWFDTGDTNPTTLAESIAGNDYIQFVVTPTSGFSFTPTSFVFGWDRSGTGPQNVALRSSVDGYAANLGVVTGMAAAITSGNTIIISGLTNITTATTFRLYGYGATGTGGTGGFDQGALNVVNVQLNGTTASTGPYTVASGDWNVATTWSTNPVVPISTDNVTISTGHTVYTTSALTRTGTTTVNGVFELRNGGWASGTNFSYNNTTSGLNFNDTANYAVNNTDVFWPAANGPFNVSVLQGGMTMNATTVRTVVGTFAVGGAGVTITAPSTLTLNGTCQINAGGFFNNSPINGSASTLVYNTTMNIGNEWTGNATAAGSGIPQNVTIQNSATVTMPNSNRGMAGNLTITSGSLVLNATSGDLYIAGNFSNTGTFTHNNREIYFTKAAPGVQTVFSSSALTIPVVHLTGGGNTLQLLSNLTISAPGGGNAINFSNNNDILDLNGFGLTIGTDSTANTIGGTGLGTIKASTTGPTTSSLTLLGTNSVGTLRFTTGFQNLGTFVINRTAGTIGCVMGSAVTINTTVTLTAGIIDLGDNPMTISATGTITGASSSNYIIADVGNGVNASLRKSFTTAETFAFPIGDRAASANGMQYSPISVTFTGGSYAGYAGFAVNDIKHPNMDATTNFISRYWSMTSSGLSPTSYSVTGTYLPVLGVDINGTESSSQSNQWNGSTWTNGGTLIGSNTMTILNCTTLPAINHFSAGQRDQEINIVQGVTPYLTTSEYDFGTRVVGTTTTVVFTVQNTGQRTLTFPSATILSGNPPYSDSVPLTTGNLLGGATRNFSISFAPTAAGTFTGSITIYSNDSDEGTGYVINFTGIAVCPTTTITSVTPTSGPAGTNVIINAIGGDLSGTTVMFNAIPATIISSSSTQLVVTIPDGATTGNIVITKTATGCITTTPFTVIYKTGACAGMTELIMTEIYDQDGFSLGYIEVFNGTGSVINLSTYFIRRYADNAAFLANNYTDYTFSPSITTIANGAVKYGRISTDSNTATPDFDYSTTDFAGINGDDIFHLYRGTTIVDVYIVPNNTVGYTAKRSVTTLGPNTTSNPSDWTHTTTETTADLGTFAYVPPVYNIPTVDTDPVDVTTCNAVATFSVDATASSGGSLTYQWYYNSGVAAGWTAVAAGSFTGVVATGFAADTLTISGAIGALNNYQFYCGVIQNGTCTVASDAAQLTANIATWNGSIWVGGISPSLTRGAIIAGTYNMATLPSFEACSLTVNSPNVLTITTGKFAAIQNDLFVNTGAILTVQNNGSLVMIDDAGVVTNNGTTQVLRTTTPYERYDYTYWSSPVNAANISSTFTGWRTDYSFDFVTANFYDTRTINSGVGNIFGDDSFDDVAPWSWQAWSGAMTNGKGYAIMAPTSGTFPATSTVTFSGKVNNGVILPKIFETANIDAGYVGVNNANDDYNLVGNPYPCAISADKFITANGSNISGALYFWTHVDDISVSNPGPDVYNFISDDYAVYTFAGGVGTRPSISSPSSATPSGFIASGQGFFVEAQANNVDLIFNNDMRIKTPNVGVYHDNTNFYRTSINSLEKDRIWLNLQNADGMFGQQLVAYFDETTLGFDWAYDGRVNQINNYVSFYSLAGDEKYKIQARPTFDESDIVPLSYFSAVSGEFSISIDNKEGILNAETTNIYVEDLEMHIIHDLKQSPYTFTTVKGRFENRFILRYTDDSALDNPDFEIVNNSVVVATNQGELTIKSYLENMQDVTVYDILGRQLFEAKGISNTEFIASNISRSKQTLIVKIKLENGVVVTRKILL